MACYGHHKKQNLFADTRDLNFRCIDLDRYCTPTYTYYSHRPFAGYGKLVKFYYGFLCGDNQFGVMGHSA
jgi:hypothetical protein